MKGTPTRRQGAVVVVLGVALMAILIATQVGAQPATQDHSTNDGVVYSGCFHRNKITKVRLADKDPERCEEIPTISTERHARYVTWSEKGSQGPEGPQGPSGLAGADGADSPFTPFYVTVDPPFDSVETVVVFTYETITVSLRCTHFEFTEGPPNDRVELLVSSTEDGWYLEDDDSTPQAAGAEFVVAQRAFDFATPLFTNTIDDAVIGTPAGHVVGWDGESLALGLNVFDHKCLGSGNIWGMTGSP